MAHENTLLSEVEAFLKARHLTPTTFGLKAIGDPHLVHDMRRGRDLRQSTVKKIHQFMGAA